MAEVEKLVGSESPLEVGQKINEIIENSNDINNKISDYLLEIPQSIDGRWVGKELQITSSMSSATYDLSSYLPKDDYDYEVMIAVRTYAGSDGNESYFAVYSDIIPRSLSWLNCWGNNASRQNADVFTLPVSTSRKVYTYGSSMASGQVFAIGYRRIGTNI